MKLIKKFTVNFSFQALLFSSFSCLPFVHACTQETFFFVIRDEFCRINELAFTKVSVLLRQIPTRVVWTCIGEDLTYYHSNIIGLSAEEVVTFGRVVD